MSNNFRVKYKHPFLSIQSVKFCFFPYSTITVLNNCTCFEERGTEVLFQVASWIFIFYYIWFYRNTWLLIVGCFSSLLSSCDSHLLCSLGGWSYLAQVNLVHPTILLSLILECWSYRLTSPRCLFCYLLKLVSASSFCNTMFQITNFFRHLMLSFAV